MTFLEFNKRKRVFPMTETGLPDACVVDLLFPSFKHCGLCKTFSRQDYSLCKQCWSQDIESCLAEQLRIPDELLNSKLPY